MPVSLDGERLDLVELLDACALAGRRHGVGILDHIEDRIVGLKVRDLYEVPAAEILLTAHQELEKLVCTIHQNEFKHVLDRKWAYLVYAGLWHEPLRSDLDAYMESVNEQVTGEITMRLYKGSARAVARQLAERPLRPGAGGLRRVGRAVLPAGQPGLHRAVEPAVENGLRNPQPGQGDGMNSKTYSVLGWIVWQLGSRLAKMKMAQNRVKLGAAGIVALVLVGGVIAARGGDDD